MPKFSNRKRKFIKRYFRQLSVEELASQSGLTRDVVRSPIDEYSAGTPRGDQDFLSKLSNDKGLYSITLVQNSLLIWTAFFTLDSVFSYQSGPKHLKSLFRSLLRPLWGSDWNFVAAILFWTAYATH